MSQAKLDRSQETVYAQERKEADDQQSALIASKPFKSQLSLPIKERAARRSQKRAIQARSNSQLEPINSNEQETLEEYDIDFNFQLKNVGEVAAMALLKHRMQHGSITSADVPLAFRRNAAVLRDIKNVALYHQYMKKSFDQKSSSGLYHASMDSRTSRASTAFGWSNSQQSITKLVKKKKLQITIFKKFLCVCVINLKALLIKIFNRIDFEFLYFSSFFFFLLKFTKILLLQ